MSGGKQGLRELPTTTSDCDSLSSIGGLCVSSAETKGSRVTKPTAGCSLSVDADMHAIVTGLPFRIGTALHPFRTRYWSTRLSRSKEAPMLSESIVSLLNRQINLEYFSSNQYLQMAAHCAFKGFEGCSAFLRGHAREELVHMQKLFDYVQDCGALPVLGAIEAPKTDYSSVADVFRKTLEHEQFITGRINELAGAALGEKDFSTFHFLQWYVAEQHEEERLFMSIIDKLRIIGEDGRGIYFFDKEMRKLATPQ